MNKNSTLSGNRTTSISISSHFRLVLLSAIILLTVLSLTIVQHADLPNSETQFQSTTSGAALIAMDNFMQQENNNSSKKNIYKLCLGTTIIKLVSGDAGVLPTKI